MLFSFVLETNIDSINLINLNLTVTVLSESFQKGYIN